MVINVTIKTLNSQTFNFDDLAEDLTVGDFKEQIQSAVNVSVPEQRLIFCGRVLQDDKRLIEYDCNGKTIHLVHRPPPVEHPDDNQSSSNRNNNPNDDNNNNPTLDDAYQAFQNHFHRHHNNNVFGSNGVPNDNRSPYVGSIDGNISFSAITIPPEAFDGNALQQMIRSIVDYANRTSMSRMHGNSTIGLHIDFPHGQDDAQVRLLQLSRVLDPRENASNSSGQPVSARDSNSTPNNTTTQPSSAQSQQNQTSGTPNQATPQPPPVEQMFQSVVSAIVGGPLFINQANQIQAPRPEAQQHQQSLPQHRQQPPAQHDQTSTHSSSSSFVMDANGQSISLHPFINITGSLPSISEIALTAARHAASIAIAASRQAQNLQQAPQRPQQPQQASQALPIPPAPAPPTQTVPQASGQSTAASAPVMMDVSDANDNQETFEDAFDDPHDQSYEEVGRPSINSSQIDASLRSSFAQHPEWISIIQSDIERQSRGQAVLSGPLSDAYIETIPKKRRRLVKRLDERYGVLQPQSSQAISSILRKAIDSSSVQSQASSSSGSSSVLEIIDTLSGDTSLTNAYDDYIRSLVAERLEFDRDYRPSKFTNCERYFFQ